MMNESEVIKAHLSCDVSNERFQLTSRVHLPRCINERLHLGKIGHDPASLYVTKMRDGNTIAPAQEELLLQIKSIVEAIRSEEHTSELQSLMRLSYPVFCLTKTQNRQHQKT